MDFSIPPEFWWSTDNLSASIFLQGVDQKILPCGQGRIDSVKINPSLLMMTDCPCSTKTREVLGNPSPPPSRFPSTLEKFLGSREIFRPSGMDFPIPPSSWWSTDTFRFLDALASLESVLSLVPSVTFFRDYNL